MKRGLTGNQLKFIALLAMTLDHIGVTLLPGVYVLRCIGRLAFPIYAYMIAEGCRHTRSMGRYLGTLAAVAAGCQAVYGLFMGSLYQCILVTFSLSVGLCALFAWAKKTETRLAAVVTVAAGLAVLFLTEVLPYLLPGFCVDYGFLGVMLPVAVYLSRTKRQRLFFSAVILLAMGVQMGVAQWLSLLALPLLALYNGQRGRLRCKYLFYVYYPAHLVVIYILSLVL